jgi:hypothetical protein
MWMRRDDVVRGGLAFRQRQRQAVRHVRPDSEHERVRFVPIEEAHRDVVLVAEFGRPQPVHAVDDPHRRAVHDDRRQFVHSVGKCPDMFQVLARDSWRPGDTQRPDGDPDHRSRARVRVETRELFPREADSEVGHVTQIRSQARPTPVIGPRAGM